ncbi:MAG: DedA family protein, partial [Mesorhizobium sp.]
MDILAIYGGLFALAFAAATILPAQSEAALTGLLT